MKYTQKDIIATVFLKKGNLVTHFQDHTIMGDTLSLIRSFNDSGIDKIILYDLSDDEAEHEENLRVLKEITAISELPVCAGGNISSIQDVKKILYSGCNKVILNSLKKETMELAKAGAERFGKERIALSLFNMDVLFKQKEMVCSYVSELMVLDERLAGRLDGVTEVPYSILARDFSREEIRDILRSDENIKGISCRSFSIDPGQVLGLKEFLKEEGIGIDHLTSSMDWSSFKLNSDGMIPVIVQDFETNEVLMLAYMNEEAYRTTLETGKMTYYSRSRNELWIKGLTSGHFQYVKSLKIDCDQDTILARVSQIGAACHTGNRSCFYTDLATDEYMQKNLMAVLTNTYDHIKSRKEQPKSGSYTHYLFDKGLDFMVKKLGAEAASLLVSAKNDDREDTKSQIADLLYHVMVLMVEKGITLDEILEEMMMR